MLKLSILIALVVSIGFAGQAFAQQDASQRTRDLVAALDKTKYKKKEKANISIEVYVDVRNEAALRSNPAEYTGTYETEGCRLDLHVDKSGAASGGGYDSLFDSDKHMNFTLKGARIDGALLTATKVYDTGESLPFEAVFVNRTSRAGTRPDAITDTETKFGLGFIQKNSGLNGNEEWTNRVFLERR
jgi:hypothetical protein